MRLAVSTTFATVLLVVGILIGAGGYYVTTNLLLKTQTTTVYVPAFIQTPGTVQGGTLYVTNVVFSGGNITVTVSNSGGGTPIVGYGNTGQIARWLGSIIIYNGQVYSRWAWPCNPNDPCAVAPGPWRYFAFEGNSTTLDVPWNQGPGTYYGAPMTVNGLMSVPMIYHWTSGANYTIYLEDVNNIIVYQATITASA